MPDEYPYRRSSFSGAAMARAIFLVACFVGVWLFAFGERLDNYGHGRVARGYVAEKKYIPSSRTSRPGYAERGYSRYLVRYGGHEKWMICISCLIGEKDAVYVNFLPEKPSRAYIQWGSGNSLLNLLFAPDVWFLTLLALTSMGLLILEIPGMWRYLRYARRYGM